MELRAASGARTTLADQVRQDRVTRAPLVREHSRADQSAVTLGNTDGEIAGPTIPPDGDGRDPPTQGELQALRDKCEELADGVRALPALVHAPRGAFVTADLIKGGA